MAGNENQVINRGNYIHSAGFGSLNIWKLIKMNMERFHVV